MEKTHIILGLLASFALARTYAVPYGNLASSIDGWLYHLAGKESEATFADWLGLKYYGKNLREPINVVIIDPYSESEAAAVAKLMKQCKSAGYEEEYGHSSGYCGKIDGRFYKQVPNDRHMAFSNKDFFQTNNHGRIIGAATLDGAFVFIAAFSTERPSIFRGFKHLFVSFNKARNDFGAKMDRRSSYKEKGYLSLGNTLNTAEETTADHDGKALVLVAEN